MTDANRRLAMRWGDFDFVKNPVGSTYSDSKQISTTVTSQLEDDNSLLNHYAEVLAIRHKYAAIARGDYNAVTSSNKNFGGFYIDYKGETIGLFHNTSATELTIDISRCSGLDGHVFTELCDFVGNGASLNGTMLTIGGNTSVILK
jgi:glycosidase